MPLTICPRAEVTGETIFNALASLRCFDTEARKNYYFFFVWNPTIIPLLMLKLCISIGDLALETHDATKVCNFLFRRRPPGQPISVFRGAHSVFEYHSAYQPAAL